MDVKKDCIFLCAIILYIIVDNIDASIPNYYMEDHCDQMLNLNFGTVEAVRLRLSKNEKYPDGMRCRMIVQAPEGKRLSLRLQEFDLDANNVFPSNQNNNPNTGLMQQQCGNGDYALFYDGPDENALPIRGLPGRVCHKPDQKTYMSSGRYVSLIFMSDRNMMAGKGMKLLVTAFSDAPCKDNQFMCVTSGICIQKSLECDGTINCHDSSDEAMPKCLSTGAIIGIAVGGGVVLIAIIVVIVICIVSYQRRKRARIIKMAIDRGQHPYVVWDGDDTDAIFSASTREHIRKYSSIGSNESGVSNGYDVAVHDGVIVGPNHTQVSTENSEDQDSYGYAKVIGPNGEDMIKYPSGYWDITLSDLGITPVTEM